MPAKIVGTHVLKNSFWWLSHLWVYPCAHTLSGLLMLLLKIAIDFFLKKALFSTIQSIKRRCSCGSWFSSNHSFVYIVNVFRICTSEAMEPAGSPCAKSSRYSVYRCLAFCTAVGLLRSLCWNFSDLWLAEVQFSTWGEILRTLKLSWKWGLSKVVVQVAPCT